MRRARYSCFQSELRKKRGNELRIIGPEYQGLDSMRLAKKLKQGIRNDYQRNSYERTYDIYNGSGHEAPPSAG